MKFDYTKGNKANYVTSAHRWNGSDHYYFHYYGEAKVMFDQLRRNAEAGTTLTISDLNKDVRKAYIRL